MKYEETAEFHIQCILDDSFYVIPYNGFFEQIDFMERVLKRIYELEQEK